MFGDGVDETTGGNICPVSPERFLPPRRAVLADIPGFHQPLSIAVDNSGGPSQGRRLRRRRDRQRRDGTISKFDSAGSSSPAWGTAGTMAIHVPQQNDRQPLHRRGLDSRRLRHHGGSSSRSSSYDYAGNRRFIHERGSRPGATAISPSTRTTTSGPPITNRVPLIADVGAIRRHRTITRSGRSIRHRRRAAATNPANSDVLTVLNDEAIYVFERSCEPTKGYCAPKESFGAGQLPTRRRRSPSTAPTTRSTSPSRRGRGLPLAGRSPTSHRNRPPSARPTRSSPRTSIRSAPATSPAAKSNTGRPTPTGRRRRAISRCR